VQKTVPADFDDYVRHFPERTQTALRKVWSTIRKAAPRADETISYNLPAFSLSGKTLVWFAAFKSHIGFYPGAAALAAFADDLSTYKTAKGSVQFPLDRPLPLRLIDRIVRFRVREPK
jgi:uncharacterized protein YdhG (YjbR/CyaY superfamily)